MLPSWIVTDYGVNSQVIYLCSDFAWLKSRVYCRSSQAPYGGCRVGERQGIFELERAYDERDGCSEVIIDRWYRNLCLRNQILLSLISFVQVIVQRPIGILPKVDPRSRISSVFDHTVHFVVHVLTTGLTCVKPGSARRTDGAGFGQSTMSQVSHLRKMQLLEGCCKYLVQHYRCLKRMTQPESTSSNIVVPRGKPHLLTVVNRIPGDFLAVTAERFRQSGFTCDMVYSGSNMPWGIDQPNGRQVTELHSLRCSNIDMLPRISDIR